MIRDKNIAPGANIDLAKIAGGGGLGSPLGKTLWVDSASHKGIGTDDRLADGTKARPFATVAEALERCEDDKCDVILVAPGHTETITGVGGLTINKRTVTVRGLGKGNIRPTFLMDGAATVTCLMTAADACLSNLIFKAGHADIATCIATSADGCVIEYCKFVENTAGENFLIAVSVGTSDNNSDGVIVRFNEMYSVDTAATEGVKVVKNQHLVLIEGNWIHGDFAANGGGIRAPDTEVVTAIRVIDNQIDNNAADTVDAISFNCAACTGIIARNVSSDGDTDGTPFLFNGGSLCENYHTAVDAASGFLYPAIAT